MLEAGKISIREREEYNSIIQENRLIGAKLLRREHMITGLRSQLGLQQSVEVGRQSNTPTPKGAGGVGGIGTHIHTPAGGYNSGIGTPPLGSRAGSRKGSVDSQHAGMEAALHLGQGSGKHTHGTHGIHHAAALNAGMCMSTSG